MRSGVAPMTFGARLALRRPAPEEARWFFNVPDELPGDTEPPTEPVDDDKIQIAPLDV
ncbi:hypothetical protein [Achromobacter denitrificans]|uniref:hypothetical protein n=1 Tax=Achromobacter denitrificans TaxID=32002 RepID=UPI0023E8C6B3|nr:hypothetical protein [Achromobacter denitrificans]MDF3852321.1 hypothetical protein [Achromobacter denitrificans]